MSFRCFQFDLTASYYRSLVRRCLHSLLRRLSWENPKSPNRKRRFRFDSIPQAQMSSSSPSGSGGDDLSERRGIPAAKFIQDVETYLSQSGFDSNSALAFHQERLLLSHFQWLIFVPFRWLSLYWFVSPLFRLQQYKVVEMKLLAQQRDLQVCMFFPLCI